MPETTHNRREAEKLYMSRESKETKILVRLHGLSLEQREAQIELLKKQIEKAEKLIVELGVCTTRKNRIALVAAEDDLLELKYRQALEKSEYLVQKTISPAHPYGNAEES
jgi:hypothetical protein